MTVRLSVDQARRLVLTLQGLADRPRRLSADGVVDLVERLGFVQLDSINTVARAHHMILLARNQTYRPKLLRRPLEDARLFEHWTDRIAAIIPTPFYPNWNRRFRRERARLERSFGRWVGEGFKEEVDHVLAHVRAHGPVMARDFAGEAPARPRGWWDWHAHKTALEYLWRTGRLAVARREGFQKVYDLAERVIPAALRARPALDADAAHRELLLAAADALGVATADDLADYYRLGVTATRDALDGLVAEGMLEPLQVTGWDRVAYRAQDARLPRSVDAAALLTPFDPLVWYRARAERVFDFHYRLEFYVPPEQRRYGYFVMPFVLGDTLTARVDVKADRRAGVVRVPGAFAEPVVDPAPVAGPLLDELRTLAGWLDLDGVVVDGEGALDHALRRAAGAGDGVVSGT
jgi:uncharacterized protein YcaQ